MQEGFGLAPEVLVVAVDGEVQARTLHEASGEVVQSGLRIDGNLVDVLVGLAHGVTWEDEIAEHGGPDEDAGRTLRNFGLVSPENTLAEGLAWRGI